MRKKLLKLLRDTEKENETQNEPRSFSPEGEPNSGDFRNFLKEVDRDNLLKNEYTQFDEEYQCEYSVEEYLDFPDYRFVIKKINDLYSAGTGSNPPVNFPGRGIMAELKRMEIDGLVNIGTQEGTLYATTESSKGPNFDEGTKITRKSIILTTKGKSERGYLLYQLEEQRFAVWALIFSFISIIISLLALNFDKFLFV